MEHATQNRTEFYDWEHWIRQIEYAWIRSRMIRDTIGPRRVVQYATLAGSFWNGRLAQYHQLVNIQGAHKGLNVNLRELGWVAFGELLALQVDKNRSQTWLHSFLDLCNDIAFPATGQLCSGPNTGGDSMIPQNVQYTFHWSQCAWTTLQICAFLGKDPPQWVLDGMNSLEKQPGSDYYGQLSMPAFLYTNRASQLVPAVGPGQHPDPAFGWWSNLCATLAIWDKNQIVRAAKWGPTVATDEQSRIETMLIRGLT
jgi:hypothetical protein